MIRVIKRCMGKKNELKEYRWNFHPAFLHFGLKKKSYKNTFINGKPLKWYHIFRNGDIVEVLEKPNGIIETLSMIFLACLVAHPVLTVLGTLAVVGLVGVGIAAAVGAFSQNSTVGATTEKSYSSTSQSELSGASNEISTSIIPVLFGKTQQTPNYGQTPYRIVGDGSSTNKYHCYFVSNYKDVACSEFCLGDTNINDYSVDYIDIDIVSGSSNFIGFDNCKAVDVNEELSYDSEGIVDQSNNYNYNQTITSSTSVKVDFEIDFTKVDLSNWATKNFTLNLVTSNGTTQTTSTATFTVASSNLTLVSGTTYKYVGSATFSVTATSIVSSKFYPTSYTRNNSTETTNELDATYVSETITATTTSGTTTTTNWTNTKTFNQGINYYLGTVSEVVQTSPAGTTEIDVIISFPSGLYHANTDGSRSDRTAKVEIDYKLDGDTTWKTISSATSLFIRQLDGTKGALSTSNTTISGNVVTVHSTSDMNLADQLFFRPIGFVVPSGKYSVRVRSADYSDKSNYDIGYPYCAEIQFRMTETQAVASSILPKVNQIALTATAYKGLSGTLKKVNYIGEEIVPIWNGTDWNTSAKTTNPAAIIRNLLTNSLVNPRAEEIKFIDNDSLVELYEWCESEGFKASGCITDETKISDIVSNILSNCESSMIPLYNGKHTFVIDKPNKTPKGLFNQHNSWDFKWYPSIGRQTEAIRASFTNNDGYVDDELTVYLWSDGTIHETPESGKTDSDYEIIKKDYKYVNERSCVLKIAIYELEQLQKKRNNFEFSVNLEALNMMLLDRIYVSNTTNMQNESSGLIKSVITDKGNLTGFELYSEIEIAKNSKIVIRSLDYVNEEAVINIYDVTNTGTTNVVNITPIAYDGVIKGACDNFKGIEDTWHYDGDLFVLGQDTIYDCTVTDIKPGDNMTATITCRDYKGA